MRLSTGQELRHSIRMQVGRILAITMTIVLAAGLALWGASTTVPFSRTATAADGNAGSDIGDGPDPGWVPFGPFQKPAVFADEVGITGPSVVRIPSVGIVRLEAADFLPQMIRYAPDMEILSQQYTYAFDGSRPLLVAVVEVAEKLHYRRHVDTKLSTYVLGLSPEARPRVLTTWPLYRRGVEHTVSLTGLSDEGVVVFFVEGMHDGVNDGTRIDGIDVARGTAVWRLRGGFLGAHSRGAGAGDAEFYSASAADACATEAERFRIASGVVTTVEEFAGGIPCHRADDLR